MDDFTKARIKKILDNYTESKYPKHIQDQMKLVYKIRGNNVTLFEERPAFRGDALVHLSIAQFRLDQDKWKVYWQDSKDKWHFVEEIKPDTDFEKQLMKVDKNNTGIFWG